MKAEWADGKVLKPDLMDSRELFTTPQQLDRANYSADGARVTFSHKFTYDTPGTYFPTVKVWSQRHGTTDPYTMIDNLDRVRIVVK